MKNINSSRVIFFLISLWIIGCSKINSSRVENSARQKIISTNPKQITKTKDDNLYLRKINWNADTTHSSIEFRTKHSGVYDVIGWIQSFSIKMEGQKKDFTDVLVEATADIRTVKMPNPEMAGNLQGMFDTQNHPRAYFKSKTVSVITINKFKLIGDMTIKGITKEIELNVQFNGFGNPLASGVPGFLVKGRFNRADFNIGESDFIKSPEIPYPLIGDTIYFKSNLRFFVED